MYCRAGAVRCQPTREHITALRRLDAPIRSVCADCECRRGEARAAGGLGSGSFRRVPSLSAGSLPAHLGVTLPNGDTDPLNVVLEKRPSAGQWIALVTLLGSLIVDNS